MFSATYFSFIGIILVFVYLIVFGFTVFFCIKMILFMSKNNQLKEEQNQLLKDIASNLKKE